MVIERAMPSTSMIVSGSVSGKKSDATEPWQELALVQQPGSICGAHCTCKTMERQGALFGLTYSSRLSQIDGSQRSIVPQGCRVALLMPEFNYVFFVLKEKLLRIYCSCAMLHIDSMTTDLKRTNCDS